MASLVEARDPYAGGHLWRVARFSRLLAAKHGLPVKDVARIAVGGFLHDLGKVGMPMAKALTIIVVRNHHRTGDHVFCRTLSVGLPRTLSVNRKNRIGPLCLLCA